MNGIDALLMGAPVGEAIIKTKAEYRKLIKRYGNSEDDFGDAPSIGLALSWDMLSLDIEGDAMASF